VAWGLSLGPGQRGQNLGGTCRSGAWWTVGASKCTSSAVEGTVLQLSFQALTCRSADKGLSQLTS
jgi:hypothetical protein